MLENAKIEAVKIIPFGRNGTRAQNAALTGKTQGDLCWSKAANILSRKEAFILTSRG